MYGFFKAYFTSIITKIQNFMSNNTTPETNTTWPFRIEIIQKNNQEYVEFYGSSSEEANAKHYGGLNDYRSSEGKTVQILYRGELKNTIYDILGGVRSSCTYVGAPTLKQLSKCTTFIRVARQYNDTFK